MVSGSHSLRRNAAGARCQPRLEAHLTAARGGRKSQEFNNEAPTFGDFEPPLTDCVLKNIMLCPAVTEVSAPSLPRQHQAALLRPRLEEPRFPVAAGGETAAATAARFRSICAYASSEEVHGICKRLARSFSRVGFMRHSGFGIACGMVASARSKTSRMMPKQKVRILCQNFRAG